MVGHGSGVRLGRSHPSSGKTVAGWLTENGSGLCTAQGPLHSSGHHARLSGKVSRTLRQVASGQKFAVLDPPDPPEPPSSGPVVACWVQCPLTL